MEDDVEAIIEGEEDNDLTHKKWLIVKERTCPQDYTSLLKEVESLKNMIIELNILLVNQSETIGKMNDNMIVISKEIIRSRSTFYYIKSYLFPVLKLAGTYSSFILLLSSNTGVGIGIINFILNII